MSSLFAPGIDLARLAAASHGGTIMGLWLRDPPGLPLDSRDIDLPTPPILPVPAPAIIRPRLRAVRETRDLTLALHRRREALVGWDRSLVRELVRWRCEPSAWEADQIAELAERIYWQARDGAAPC